MSPVLIATIVLVALVMILMLLFFGRYSIGRSRYERMLASLTRNERKVLSQLEASADRNWGKKQNEAFEKLKDRLRQLGYSASQVENEIVYTEGNRGYEFGGFGERPKRVP